MEHNSSKEVILDIEICESSHEADVKNDPVSGNKWGNFSLSKLVSGFLTFNVSTEKPDGVSSGRTENDEEREKEKSGKVKKAPKPPRPPRCPSLDAADMRLIKEISKIAMKKRERIERIKRMKKIKASRLLTSSSSSLSLSWSGSTISAMVITVVFFLVLIFQGLGSSSTGSNMLLTGAQAPQPAPETTPFQFYETAVPDDGGASSFVPPKSTTQ